MVAIILILLALALFIPPFVKGTLAQSKYLGPMYNEQWQNAEQWVKANTNEDDVFVHWWDYGYLVQTGFNRATVTDGGNSAGSWNYFVGRYILTSPNETEALEFMKTHSVDYLLAVSEEIGKYTAFSSIGSGVTYDRFSWLTTFNLDEKSIQQTRDGYKYIYLGSTALDEDIIYNGNLFPARAAGIGAILIPVRKEGNITQFGQPSAALVSSSGRVDLKMSCLYFNGKIYEFEDYELDACARITPRVDGENVNPVGSLIYISPRVKRGLFAKLYLLDQGTENIKLVYSDEGKGRPLIVYNGRLFGPLRIWKISYPSYIKENPEYLRIDFPDPRVTVVDKSLYG